MYSLDVAAHGRVGPQTPKNLFSLSLSGVIAGSACLPFIELSLLQRNRGVPYRSAVQQTHTVSGIDAEFDPTSIKHQPLVGPVVFLAFKKAPIP